MSSVRRMRQGAPGVSLFTGDESLVQPAVQGGGRESELGGGVGHGEQLSVLWGRSPGWWQGMFQWWRSDWTRTGGERQSAGGAAVLPVEDPGDGGVGVVHGQPAQQVDGVLAGAQPLRRFPLERHGQFGDRAALPAQDELGAAVVVVAVHA